MITTDTSLQELARQLGKGLSGPLAFHQALESSLNPLIRRALSSGRGPSALLRWLQSQPIPKDRQAIQALVSDLAQRLLRHLDPLSSRETVVGP